MTGRALALLLVAALPALPALPTFAGAQTTAEKIARAKSLYNSFQVEAARPLLLEIISPNYLQQVLPQERVEAYKYLGASYALLEEPDSARTFFVAALDFDPFTDLDLETFGPQEQTQFAEAKKTIFKVGVAPIRQRVVVPALDTTAYVFRIITTSRGNLEVALVNQRDSLRPGGKELLYQGTSDGLRQIPWTGVLASGQFADTGIYMLRAVASREGGQPTQAQQLFRLEHHFEPLEDTLPDFRPDQLLQERIPGTAPYLDLAKGLLAAGATFGIGFLASGQEVSGWQTHVTVAGAVGLAGGAWSFFYRRANRSIAANVQENNRRRAERSRFNAEVIGRNNQRLAARWIIITPVAGFSR